MKISLGKWIGFLCINFLLATASLHATTNYWTGAGGDNSWSNPNNWSLQTLPTATEDVVIDLPGTYTVELDDLGAAAKLEIGAATGTQTLRVTGSFGYLTQATILSNGVFELAGGDLTSDRIEWNGPGTAIWSSGSMNQTTNVINSSSHWNIIDGGTKYFETLENHGTVSIQTASLTPINVFDNWGVINIEATIASINGLIRNTGTIRSLPNTTVILDVGMLTNAGTFRAETNSTLTLSGNYAFRDMTIEGDGVVRLAGSAFGDGSILVNGTFLFEDGFISSPTVWDGPGTFIWQGGIFNDLFSTYQPHVINTNLHLRIVDGGSKSIYGFVENRGTISLEAVSVLDVGFGFLDNRGFLDVEANTSFNGTVLNNGTIRSKAGTSVNLYSGGTLTNSGIILAETNSILSLQGSYVFDNATIDGEGIVRLTGTIYGLGLTTINGTFQLADGYISAPTAWSGPGTFVWSGGYFTDFMATSLPNVINNGLHMRVADPGARYLYSVLENHGIISLETGYSIDGSGLLDNHGILSVETYASLNVAARNSGTIRSLADSSVNLTSYGTLTNSGSILAETNSTLHLNGSYVFNNATVDGAGVVRLQGTIYGSGLTTINGTFELDGGYISSPTTWDGPGSFVWSSGYFTDFLATSQPTIINNGLHMRVVNGSGKYIDSILENHGTLSLQGSDTIQGSGLLDNQGILSVEEYASLNTAAARNSGTIRSLANSLVGLVSYGTLTNSGSVLAETNSTLNLVGSYVFNNATVDGSGVVRLQGTIYGSGLTTINGTFELDGGYISSPTTWDGPGTFVWSSGYFTEFLASGQPTIINSGLQMRVVNGSSKYIDSILENHGTLSLQTSDVIQGSGLLDNQGILILEAYTALNTAARNSGTIRSLANSFVGLISYGTLTNSGSVLAEINSTLNLGGSYVFDNATVDGAGTVRLQGTIYGSGLTTINGTFELDSGYISSPTTWDGPGTFVWSSGYFTDFLATGQPTMINSGLHMRVVTGGGKYIDSILENHGTLSLQTSDSIQGSGLLDNQGILSVEEHAYLSTAARNTGTIRSLPDTFVSVYANGPFTNSGIVLAETNSMLNLGGSYLFDNVIVDGAGVVRLQGTIYGSGLTTINGTFELDGGYISSPTIWDGPGSFVWSSGYFADFLTPSQPSIINNGLQVRVVTGGGKYIDSILQNHGLISLQTSDTIQGSGLLENYGTLSVESNICISVTFSNYALVDVLSGSLQYFLTPYSPDVASIHKFNLAGVNEGSDFGKCMFGSFTANGALTLVLTNGFVPEVGNSFTLFNYNNITGTFTQTNLPTLPSGRVWHLAYGPNEIKASVHGPLIFTSQPVSQTVPQGTNVNLSAMAVGEGPLRYQWRFNGVDLPGATTNYLDLLYVHPTNAGAYSIVVSNDYTSAVSSNAIISVIADSLAPTLAITSPKMASLETNISSLLFTGTAKDKAHVHFVLVQQNGGIWKTAHLTGPSTNRAWSHVINLSAGTNTILIQAFDLAGNGSPVQKRVVFYRVLQQLTLNTTGDGVTIPTTNAFGVPTNGAWLQVGRSYRIKAVPGSTAAFTNWTGTISSETNVLNFIMQSNMTLTANFIPNPFIPAAGFYNGLFHEEIVEHHSAGFFNLTVSTNFSYSGKINVEGDSITFSGKFPLAGTTTRGLSRAKLGKPDLLLTMSLDFSTNTDQLTGTIQASNGWTSTLIADRAVFSATNPATDYATNYTMLIPAFANAAEGPTGHTYGSLVVSTNGKSVFSGKLADGTSVTHNMPISKNGQWPFFFRSYPQLENQTNTITSAVRTNVTVYKGEMLGWITITNTPPLLHSAPTGQVSWIMTTMYPTNIFYANGFTNEANVLGSFYHPPAAKTLERALEWTNGILSIAAGNLVIPFTNALFLKTNNTFLITGTNTNTTKITLNAKTGTFSGSFRHPDNTNKVTSFNGAILQEQQIGGGNFVGTNQSGAVSLQGN